MILDSERNLLGVSDQYIYLTVAENVCLDLIIKNRIGGISVKEIEHKILPYTFNVRQAIYKIQNKILKYGQIYSEKNRFKIMCYK